LFTEKAAVALHELNEEVFHLELEIGRHQVHTSPGSEVERTEVKPDFLALGAINGAHP
jgi:hypothetical protein